MLPLSFLCQPHFHHPHSKFMARTPSMHTPSNPSWIESLFTGQDTDLSPQPEPWQQPSSSIPPAWCRFAHLNLSPFFTTHHYRFWHNINIYYHFRDTTWTVQQSFEKYYRDLQAVVNEMHFKTNIEHFAARKALKVWGRFDLFQQS